MATLSELMLEVDPQKNLNGAKLTGDTYARLHIPHSLLQQIVLARPDRRSQEFLTFCITAAHKGDSDAVSLLALIAYGGYLDDGRKRLTIARPLAEAAHHFRNSFGTFVLGAIDLEEREYRSALKNFENAANSDFPPATWFAGKMYEVGIGVRKDTGRALSLYQAGRKLGFILSDVSYADLLRSGQFGFFRAVFATLMLPVYKVRFFVRNRFMSRTSATHLLPENAGVALLSAIENS